MPGNRKLSIAWLVSLGLGASFTAFEVAVPPAPTGDEIFQRLALGVILLLLGLVAGLFSPRLGLNSLVFSVLFLCGHLSIWYRVAHSFVYPIFGPQLWTGMMLGLVFFVLLFVFSLCLRLLVDRLWQSQAA